MMKAYTDLEQSKKLAEILPIESADMAYIASLIDDDGEAVYTAEYKSEIIIHDDDDYINCWSLAALLRLIPNVVLDGIEHNTSNEVVWTCSSFPNNFRRVTCEDCVEPVDACVEAILKLKQQGFYKKA